MSPFETKNARKSFIWIYLFSSSKEENEIQSIQADSTNIANENTSINAGF